MNAAEDFSPEASLFIGNKWENIPEKDRKDVKEEIFRKLDKVYPGITEEQLHFMSVLKVPIRCQLFQNKKIHKK